MRALALFLIPLLAACGSPATTPTVVNPAPVEGAPVIEIAGPDSSSPKLKFIQFTDHQFAAIDDFKFVFASTHQSVTVPAGFVTDFASIPKLVAPLFRKQPHALPGLVHDYLYWTWRCTRKQADRLFLLATTQLGATPWKADAMFAGLRIGGEGAWKQNQAERGNRLPRVIPPNAMHVPGATSWHDYRLRLRDQEHVPLDELGPENQPYCKTGDE